MHSSFESQRGISRVYERVNESLDTYGSVYQSAISPRVAHLNRSHPFTGGHGVTTRNYRSIQMSSGGFGASTFGQGGVKVPAIVYHDLRERDKRSLVTLNDKFAQYVESVRFLEAQNRKLQYEIDVMQKRSGQGSSHIQEMYQTEMDAARKLIGDTRGNLEAANAKAKKAEDELNRQKARYNQIANIRETDRKEIAELERRIGENEAQISLFRRRIADLEDEGHRYKAESQRLNSEISRVQNDIQNEMMNKASCDAEKYAMEDRIATLRREYALELENLRGQSESSNIDPIKFLDSDAVRQLRQIRADYENAIANQRESFQARHAIEVSQIVHQIPVNLHGQDNAVQRRQEETIRSDVTKIKNQNSHLIAQNQGLKNRIDDLALRIKNLKESSSINLARTDNEIADAKARLAKSAHQYDELTSLKVTLEKEIGTYRDLLESQNGLRPCVDRIMALAEQPAAIERFDSAVGSSMGRTTITHKVITNYNVNYRT